MAGPLAARLTAAADRVALQRMLEPYQHDLSDLWDQDLDARGEMAALTGGQYRDERLSSGAWQGQVRRFIVP